MEVVPATDSLDTAGSMSDLASNSTSATTAPSTPDRGSSFSPSSTKLVDSQSPAVLKSEEYRQLFRLQPDEVLVQDFNCALQENILLQGHMYVFTNYVCFYANIFGFETKKVIPYRDISSVKRAKTAGIFSNAIEIFCGDKRLFFASFLSRDEALRLIEEGCLQSGLKNPSTEQQENGTTVQAVNDMRNDDLTLNNRLDDATKVIPSSSDVEGDFVTITESHVDEIVDDVKLPDNALEDSCGSSNSLNWNIENFIAPEISKNYTMVAEGKFSIKVKDFFDHFFSDAAIDFVKEFHSRCKDRDFKCSSWTPHEKLGHKRDIYFLHPIKLYFGSKCSGCNEVQTFRVYKDSHLVIETSQDVSDVPYSDYFCVQGLWDVTRDGEGPTESCNLSVYLNVAFSKNTVFKGKIVKSTIEECRETYELWIEMANEFLKNKNLANHEKNTATTTEDIDKEQEINRLNNAETKQNADVEMIQNANEISPSIGWSMKKISLLFRNQNQVSLLLFIAFIAIILMQVTILLLLSRPQTVSIASLDDYIAGKNSGSHDTLALFERRMNHLKDEMYLLESHMDRLKKEHFLLKSQLERYEKSMKKSI